VNRARPPERWGIPACGMGRCPGIWVRVARQTTMPHRLLFSNPGTPPFLFLRGLCLRAYPLSVPPGVMSASQQNQRRMHYETRDERCLAVRGEHDQVVPLITAIAVALTFSSNASAGFVFRADLDAAQEPPPLSNSTGTGVGLFTLNDAQTQLSFTVTYQGLASPITGPISTMVPSAYGVLSCIWRTSRDFPSAVARSRESGHQPIPPRRSHRPLSVIGSLATFTSTSTPPTIPWETSGASSNSSPSRPV